MIVAGIFLIFFGFYTYHTFLVDSKKISLFMRIIFMYGYYICSGIFFYIIYKLKKDKFKNIEKKFLLISIIIGTMYALFIPTLTGTDEPPHFYRAYQISQGDVIPYKIEDYQIPKNIVELSTKTNKQYTKEKLFSSVSKEKTSTNKGIASYSPIQYIPQVLAILISNLFNLSPIVMLLLARLFNLYTFIFLAYHSIKIIPYKKTFLTILLLSP